MLSVVTHSTCNCICLVVACPKGALNHLLYILYYFDYACIKCTLNVYSLFCELCLHVYANYYKRVAGFHPYDGDIVYLHSYADGVFICNLRTDTFEVVPGYEKIDISPFQLEIADLLLPPESSSPSTE